MIFHPFPAASLIRRQPSVDLAMSLSELPTASRLNFTIDLASWSFIVVPFVLVFPSEGSIQEDLQFDA